MGDDLTIYEENRDITISRPPEVILTEAKKAASALADVVSKKKKPVIMNGEQYLEFEDWQTVGRFYGVTAKIISTNYIDYGNAQGFEAKAVALRTDGMEISAAEAMCLNDENNWKSKPLFQLRSMAQTRACAKALRNVLAWVVVLAGYIPTPAEEIQEMVDKTKSPIQPPQAKQAETQPQMKNPDAPSSEKQQKAIHSMATQTGIGEAVFFVEINSILREALPESEQENFKPVASTKELTMGQASILIGYFNTILKKN